MPVQFQHHFLSRPWQFNCSWVLSKLDLPGPVEIVEVLLCIISHYLAKQKVHSKILLILKPEVKHGYPFATKVVVTDGRGRAVAFHRGACSRRGRVRRVGKIARGHCESSRLPDTQGAFRCPIVCILLTLELTIYTG